MTKLVSRHTAKVSSTTTGEILLIENQNNSREDIMKVVSDEGFHGSAGVYYYITKRDGMPLVYAGKAYHLARRAMKESRIKSVSQVILVTLTGPKSDFGLMDENWRQQMEHLMIRDLLMRDFIGQIESENKSVESQSLCHADEKKDINIFFDKIIEELQTLCPNVFTKNPTASLKDSVIGFTKLKIPGNRGNLWTKENSRCAVVLEGVFAKPYTEEKGIQFFPSINASHQREKESLIERGVLIKDQDRFVFTRPHLFMTKTEASAILIHNNQFKKDKWMLN
jgi:hypothetical protein